MTLKQIDHISSRLLSVAHNGNREAGRRYGELAIVRAAYDKHPNPENWHYLAYEAEGILVFLFNHPENPEPS